jgi:glutamate dehydrogenase
MVDAFMTVSNDVLNNIFLQLVDHAKANISGDDSALFIKFLKMYYSHTPHHDLEQRSISDLYGAALSHWELMRIRKADETKIRIFNPLFGEHGWQSTHTIIQLVIDDMPFLVDTMRMELNRLNLTTHLMVHSGGMQIKRDKGNQLLEARPYHGADITAAHGVEAPIHMEIDRQTDPKALMEIQDNLLRVISDVRAAVDDWQPMRKQLELALGSLDPDKMQQDPHNIRESKAFLEWMFKDHFTFLGYREYKVIGEGDSLALKLIPSSGHGVLRDQINSKMLRQYSDLPQKARELALSDKQILIISKTNTMSTVHRPAYTDCVEVKQFDKKGKLIGVHRFIGLYTSEAYRLDPRQIPFIRNKVTSVLKQSKLPKTCHAAKDLLHILSTMPRDDLFHASTEELFDIATGILHLQERRRTCLFVRKDAYNRFLSCLLYVPRENFNTDLVVRACEILKEEFGALDITYSTRLSESVLARIHYVVRVDSQQPIIIKQKELESKLTQASESWQDAYRRDILDYFGEERGSALVHKYTHAFPAGYREDFSSRSAVFDIEHIEKLSGQNRLEMSFYRPLGAARDVIRFKLYHLNETIPLSDALPMLENMGLRVIGEQPHELLLHDGEKVWINDFSMVYSKEPTFEVEVVKDIFQNTFEKIWFGEAEDDALNRLVLEAEISWRQIVILRLYAKYFRQIGIAFSGDYIAHTLIHNACVARLLIRLFEAKFDVDLVTNDREGTVTDIEKQLESGLDKVEVLDEDRILRRFLDLIRATLRTNYFQVDEKGCPKRYLSVKLNPKEVPEMPLPLPRYEMFVYSPRFEGVHLRTAKVARGGIRWSDRREDFRTEVLGLMKAQQVKNSLIVPAGAKGGFVPKLLPVDGSRDDIMREGISCYQDFISGLLDLTDNLFDGEVCSSDRAVRYDGDDPYVVVAADKGTATFSDIANKIALDRDYWLGDAFASGGCTGYDHKKMAITARGAWVSVERHFQDLGTNVDVTEVTVAGVGDMSGDVFGNGLLMSEHIKLVAAFNHLHIFLDPTPDPRESFAERKRLFDLPRSTWKDYNPELISSGGGVHSRFLKSIRLTPQVKELLGTDKDALPPHEIVRLILKAKVDLLWNGGIGTYVKSKSETNADVGDRANDNVRINGADVRARVISEGGNLGLTQLGRIEAELAGCRLNTDFVDNSAGVDCSDHEVNIKILLNDIVASGDMTEKQRNTLLQKMTDEVSDLVLQDNYSQTQAISLASYAAAKHIDLHIRYIQDLEKSGKISRELEFLPDDKALLERRNTGRGLTRPELSVLFSYSKNILKGEVKRSDLINDPYLSEIVAHAFPTPLRQRFHDQMTSHYLANDIIATQIGNQMASYMGITFAYQMHDETGAPISAIVRAYTTAAQLFDLGGLYTDIESLDYLVEASVQYEMMLEARRIVRRATRWFLRNRRTKIDIGETRSVFLAHVKSVASRMHKLLLGSDGGNLDKTANSLIEKGVPEDIALRLASASPLYHSLNIIEAATTYKVEVFRVAKIYFMLVDRLDLFWFRDQINAYPVTSRWSVLAKAAYKGDLDWIQRELTVGVLLNTKARSIPGKLNAWFSQHEGLITRWKSIVTDLRSAETKEFAILFVAIRELLDLAQTSSMRGKIHLSDV